MGNGVGLNGNLIPPKKGEVRNPKGRGKGSKNLSTLIKHILEEGNLDWTKVPIKNNVQMKQMYGNHGWEAIIYVATAQALSGDVKAMQFLQRAQYGNDQPQVTVQFNQLVNEQRERYRL